MMANFICQLHWTKHDFWACLWMFLEEINIWIGRLNKDDHCTNASRHHLIWGPQQNRKAEERWICSVWAGTFIFSFPLTSAFLVLWPLPLRLFVVQSFLTLWDPMDCSLPGTSVHGISQARILWTLDLNQGLYHQFPDSQVFGLGLIPLSSLVIRPLYSDWTPPDFLGL